MTSPGDSIGRFQSIQQVVNSSPESSRRPSQAIFPGEDRRASLISIETPPIVTTTHAFASLISTDKRLRKSTTGQIISDLAISSLKNKGRGRRSRAFFESDRRRASLSLRRRDKRATPAMITLRKASKQYNCGGYGIVVRRRSSKATGQTRGVVVAAPHTPDAEDTASVDVAPGNVQRRSDSQPGTRRKKSSTSTIPRNDGFTNLRDLAAPHRRSGSLAEAKRQNLPRITTNNSSQEIIWRQSDSPSSWSGKRSSVDSPPRSNRNSENGGVPLPLNQLISQESPIPSRLTEQHLLHRGSGPESVHQLPDLEDPTGGWPWYCHSSPAHSRVQVTPDRSPQIVDPWRPYPPPLHVAKTRRPTSTSEETEKDGDITRPQRAPSSEKPQAMSFVFPKIDTAVNQDPANTVHQAKNASGARAEQWPENIGGDATNEPENTDFRLIKHSSKTSVTEAEEPGRINYHQIQQSPEGLATDADSESPESDIAGGVPLPSTPISNQQQPSNAGLGILYTAPQGEAPTEISASAPVAQGTAQVPHIATQDSNSARSLVERRHTHTTPLTFFMVSSPESRSHTLNTPITSFKATKPPAKSFDGANDKENDENPMHAYRGLRCSMSRPLLMNVLTRGIHPPPKGRSISDLSHLSLAEIDYCYEEDSLGNMLTQSPPGAARKKLASFAERARIPSSAGSFRSEVVSDVAEPKVLVPCLKTPRRGAPQKRSYSDAAVEQTRKKRNENDTPRNMKEVRFMLHPDE